MIGSSRTSIALVRDKINGEYGNAALADAGRELLAVADLLTRERQLRSALGDSGRSSSDRTSVITTLLGDRTDALTKDLAGFLVAQRWSSESDLVDAFEVAGAQSLLASAESAGRLDQVEEELFRFGRALVADGELQLVLSSPALTAAVKQSILTDLLGGKADPVTVELLGFAAGHLRGRRLEQSIDVLSELAAERRDQLVALVTVAKPMSAEQQQRLAAGLQRIYGHAVNLNIDIDPALVGGITVKIGDEVIDGSIASRLETARRRLAG